MRVIVFRVLRCGLPVSAAMFLAAGMLYAACDLPAGLRSVLAVLPLLTGCACSGYSAARNRRQAGLLTGICAALLLSGMWYLAGCVLRGRLCAPAILPAAMLCGGAGGICGVNRPAPVPAKRLRGLRRLRERTALLPLLLHRPKKPE